MIKVLKPGLFTTVQDTGRFGFRKMGVPVSGAMDFIAYNKGNVLLGNPPNSASLEITMTGPSLLFAVGTDIVITGANISPKINEREVSNDKILNVQKGDILSFGKLVNGFRSYLAVAGGFSTEKIMGSRSYMNHITSKSKLNENDTLPIAGLTNKPPKEVGYTNTANNYLFDTELQVLKGPEFELLPEIMQRKLFETDFTVSKDYNRMAYQLVEIIQPHDYSMITSATLPGTVQLTPQGKLIILMRNGQTTGGYIRVLQLTEKAVSVLAQKKFKDTLKFVL